MKMVKSHHGFTEKIKKNGKVRSFNPKTGPIKMMCLITI